MPSTGGLAPLSIGKFEEHPPIVGGHRMAPFANVIAQGPADELVLGRSLRPGQAFDAEQSIDWIGGLQDFELAGWIRPLIALGGGEEDRSWRAQG